MWKRPFHLPRMQFGCHLLLRKWSGGLDSSPGFRYLSAACNGRRCKSAADAPLHR
jgi:hypothetical protein